MATINGTIVALQKRTDSTEFAMVVQFNVNPLAIYNNDDTSVPTTSMVSFPKCNSTDYLAIMYNSTRYRHAALSTLPAIGDTITFNTAT